MSLRLRLVLVLTVVMIAPLLVAGIAVGVIVPKVARAAAADLAQTSAAGTSAALADRCRLVAATTGSIVRRLAVADPVPAAAVAPLMTATARDRPVFSVVVLGPDGRVLGATGVAQGDAARAASVQGAADCTRGEAAAVPALAYALDVRVGGSVTARVVTWSPLDDVALAGLQRAAGSATDVVLLDGAGRTVGPAPAGVTTALPASKIANGFTDGRAYALSPATSVPGQPYGVLAVTDVEARPQLVLLVAGVALLGAVLVGLVATRLTRPLAEADATQRVLSGTFSSFGEALGSTHDLDGLLRAVFDAALEGAAADAGTVWVTHVGAGGTASALEERVGTPGQDVGALDDLAVEAVMGGRPVVRDDTPLRGPLAAMPLTDPHGTPVGALVVTRERGAAGFDDAQLGRLAALTSRTGTAIANLRLHEETRRQSLTDPLTGAGNFRQLSTTLSREVERASRYDRPLSVLMLDLDHFKQVNDTLGHAFGDLVLKEVAARLEGVLREGDMLARRGGEEFTVVLPETDADGACVAASRILDVVRREPFGAEGQQRVVTLSAGVASFPADGASAQELLRTADEALYAAKDAGRDRWAAADGAGGARAASHAG